MPRPEDSEHTKLVWRTISRKPIDTSLMTVLVMHGVVYLRGQVRAMRGHDIDIRSEMEMVARILKQKPGIRDVVIDVTFRT
jgi:hypothetical protein